MPFDTAANMYILKKLYVEMAKEQIAGGGKEKDFSGIIGDIDEANNYCKEMREAMQQDGSGLFAILWNKSSTAQYYKAVVMHSKNIDLQVIPFVYCTY